MQADEIRALYAYHFALNRRLWDECIVPLTQAQFLKKFDYSIGSIRNHMVHMPNIDDNWFQLFGGRAEAKPTFKNVVHYPTRAKIRAYWDEVLERQQRVLAALTDEQVNQLVPLSLGGATVDVPLWKLMLHVINHGTDHRAQVLALLHQVGVKGFPQDLVFFLAPRR